MSYLHEQLPRISESLPADRWIHSEPVRGPFGITASVGNFEDVLDWQEHTRELVQGYYRLVHPPRVRAFKRRLEARYPGFTAVLFASGPLAEKETRDLAALGAFDAPIRAHQTLPEHPEPDQAHVLHLRDGDLLAGACLLPSPDAAALLHERNRRRGGSLSARAVAHLLGDNDAEPYDPGDEAACRAQLLHWEHADHALFYPSGMAAVTAVLDQTLTAHHPRILVMGNVYRDTHLLLEEHAWAHRAVDTAFLDTHDLEGLRDRIHDPAVGGVFVETITNPLIEIPDLPAIAEICRQNGKPMLVDHTMAAPLNATPLDLGAAVVLHSTSKYLSGHNAHGGGVVLTRDADWAARLAKAQTEQDNRLSPAEFTALRQGLNHFEDRLTRFNANGAALADLLRAHPAVERVYYGDRERPSWLNGLAGVVSCDLQTPTLEAVARFYDAPLPGVIKAPSLGSDQTLFCPYVLLAYYDKSDAYLRDCHLSKTLLRFATGCEHDFAPVLRGISDALDRLD